MIPSTPDSVYRNLSEYLSLIPSRRRNARLHLSTMLRWCTLGVRMPDGSRLRLRAVRCGCRWATTDAWFAEFLQALTTAHIGAAPSAGPRPPAERDRASRAAEARLRVLGI